MNSTQGVQTLFICFRVIFLAVLSWGLPAGDHAMCAEPSSESKKELHSQLELNDASPELQEALDKCDFEARHVTGRDLELLDVLLPPLKRNRDEMQRYGSDVYVAFRLCAKAPLVTTNGEKKLSELCVKLKPDPQQWPYSIPIQPDWAIKIPMRTFRGGVLYHTYHVFGPEDGIGEHGVQEKLVSQRWDWQICGGEFCRAAEAMTRSLNRDQTKV